MAKLYVDDVSVGVKELCVVLGIDPNSIPKKLDRIFQINPEKITKDNEGNEKTPRRLGVSTKFNIYPKGADKMLTIRYAEEAIPNNKNGYVVTRYAPAQLWINGKEELIKDDLIYFFMYIHPNCKQSPFRELDKGFRYFFLDREDIAKDDLLRDEQEMKAMSMIIGDRAMSITQLRQIAKGMNISGVDRLTDAEVKNQLKYLAKKNPNGFRDDATSNSIVFNGMLQDAVDKHIVKMVPNNGYKRWYFNSEELCVIPSGSDEMSCLKDAVIKKMDLIPLIQNAMAGISQDSELNKPENAQFFDSFKPSQSITNADISSNIKTENKALEEQIRIENDIKLLALQEEAELAGGDKIHVNRRPKLAKYRTEIDTYKLTDEFKSQMLVST